MIVLVAVLLATSAQAQPAPEGETVIVTGRSLDSTRRALAECLKRRCPPAQDIAATLAHADLAFVVGEYRDALNTLTASLGRNQRHAKTLPVAVAGLERATGRVAVHLGEPEAYHRHTWGIRRALKAGLPQDDIRLVAADMEIADMLLSTGRGEAARRMYVGAAERAAKLGRPDLATRAKVQAAWLEFQADNVPGARRILRELVADTSPEVRAARLSARMLLAKIDERERRPSDAEGLKREIAALGLKQPVLLWSPPIKDLQVGRSQGLAGPDINVQDLMATDEFDDRWIDIAFFVEPDGSVADVQVLRSRGDMSWAKGLLESLAGRRYSAGTQRVERIERYTYTSFLEARSGTRLRERNANARIEYMDLTDRPGLVSAKP